MIRGVISFNFNGIGTKILSRDTSSSILTKIRSQPFVRKINTTRKIMLLALVWLGEL